MNKKISVVEAFKSLDELTDENITVEAVNDSLTLYGSNNYFDIKELDESIFDDAEVDNQQTLTEGVSKKYRLIWDDCSATADRRPTEEEDIENDIHVEDFNSAEEVYEKLLELADIDKEDFEEDSHFESTHQKIEELSYYFSDPGDGSPNILYCPIEGDDYGEAYDSLSSLDLDTCTEEDVKEAVKAEFGIFDDEDDDWDEDDEEIESEDEFESLHEDVDKELSMTVDLTDSDEIRDGIEFLENEEESEPIEQIVDVNANTESELKKDHKGDFVLECTKCHGLKYVSREDLIKDPEQEDIYNIEDECPSCHTQSGWYLGGEISDVNATPVSEEDEVEEEVWEEPEEYTGPEVPDEVEEDVSEDEIKIESLNESKQRIPADDLIPELIEAGYFEDGDIEDIYYEEENGPLFIKFQGKVGKYEYSGGRLFDWETESLNKDIVTYGNSGDFLKKYGLDKYFYFDGRDLVDKKDSSTTGITFGSEEVLLKEIGKYFPEIFKELELDKYISEELTEASSAEKKAFRDGGEALDDLITGKSIARIKDEKARDAAIAAVKAGREEVAKEFTGDRKENQAERDFEKKADKMAKAGFESLEESNEEDEEEYEEWEEPVDIQKELSEVVKQIADDPENDWSVEDDYTLEDAATVLVICSFLGKRFDEAKELFYSPDYDYLKITFDDGSEHYFYSRGVFFQGIKDAGEEGKYLGGKVLTFPEDYKKNVLEESKEEEVPETHEEQIDFLVKDEAEYEHEDLEEADEISFEESINKCLKESYINIDSFKINNFELDGKTLLIEGKLKYKNETEEPSTFTLTLNETNEYEAKNDILNKDDKKFTFICETLDKKLISKEVK